MFPALSALLLQLNFSDLISRSGVLTFVVLGLLVVFSVYSWTIIFSKLGLFRRARAADRRFLRAFRKANGLEAVMVASEQYRPAPLVAVFDFGYEEVARQVKARGTINNKIAVERTLQLGVSEELAKLERNMNWLATTATVTPVHRTVRHGAGHYPRLSGSRPMGSTSLRAVGPGISEALITTAVGLAAAIPAAIFYNMFGHAIREIGAKMDDFANEFMNMAERSFGE